MIYLNNAATTWPKPPEVARAVAAAMAQDPAEYAALLRSSRSEICRFLGIADPSRLILTPGCTSALAVSIEDLPWREGDTVVTSSLEHHALARPVQRLARSRGVIHRQAPCAPGSPIALDFVEKELRGGSVRLVAVTAASNVTGEILPVEEIAALAHAHGALLLVDAAQTAGVIPLDCERSGADILVFAGHKGPLGPQGVGGLWAASHVAFESPSASCEVGAGSGPGGCLPFPGTCDTGSVNLPGVAGLAAGMAWLSARREAGPGTGPRALARRLATALADLRHVTLFGGPDVLRTATISMRIEGLPIERAEAFFRERGIIVRAGSHCAAMALQAIGAPEGTIRVSFGIFNTDQDRAAILGAVADAARAG